MNGSQNFPKVFETWDVYILKLYEKVPGLVQTTGPYRDLQYSAVVIIRLAGETFS